MHEVEAVREPEDGSKRPEEHLLVSSHLADVLPPELYFGNDGQFVSFIQGRANVRLTVHCVLVILMTVIESNSIHIVMMRYHHTITSEFCCRRS